MSTIKISNLHPAGANLFSDFEGYMAELSEYELGVQGGGTPTVVVSIASAAAVRSSRWCAAGAVAAGGAAVSYIKGRWF